MAGQQLLSSAFTAAGANSNNDSGVVIAMDRIDFSRIASSTFNIRIGGVGGVVSGPELFTFDFRLGGSLAGHDPDLGLPVIGTVIDTVIPPSGANSLFSWTISNVTNPSAATTFQLTWDRTTTDLGRVFIDGLTIQFEGA
jgi:hypothetical protein